MNIWKLNLVPMRQKMRFIPGRGRRTVQMEQSLMQMIVRGGVWTGIWPHNK